MTVAILVALLLAYLNVANRPFYPQGLGINCGPGTRNDPAYCIRIEEERR